MWAKKASIFTLAAGIQSHAAGLGRELQERYIESSIDLLDATRLVALVSPTPFT